MKNSNSVHENEDESIYEFLNYTKDKANRVISITKKYLKSFKELAKKEGKETKLLFEIMKKAVKDKKLTKDEKKFIKEQSKDILKMVTAGVLPTPILALLFAISKRYNLNLELGDQEELYNKIKKIK